MSFFAAKAVVRHNADASRTSLWKKLQLQTAIHAYSTDRVVGAVVSTLSNHRLCDAGSAFFPHLPPSLEGISNGISNQPRPLHDWKRRSQVNWAPKAICRLQPQKQISCVPTWIKTQTNLHVRPKLAGPRDAALNWQRSMARDSLEMFRLLDSSGAPMSASKLRQLQRAKLCTDWLLRDQQRRGLGQPLPVTLQMQTCAD